MVRVGLKILDAKFVTQVDLYRLTLVQSRRNQIKTNRNTGFFHKDTIMNDQKEGFLIVKLNNNLETISNLLTNHNLCFIYGAKKDYKNHQLPI